MQKKILISIFSLSLIIGQEQKKDSTYFVFHPQSLNINVGEKVKLNIKFVDKDQKLLNIPFTIYSANDPGIGPTPNWPGTSINVVPRVSNESGEANVTVQPKRSGELLLKVRSINGVSGELLINVPKPALDKLVFNQTPSRIYNGTVTKFFS